MEYANFVCDLHGHTNRSDGNDTPIEFLQHAAKRKMKIVGITDHDKILPDKIEINGQSVDIVKYAKSLGINLLRGIEISAETNIEDVHLVCYGCDWDNEYFIKLDQMVVRSKIDSYKKLLEKLDKKGIKITWEEVLYNHGASVEETEVQKKMIFNLIAEKGYTKDWSEAKLMVKNSPELSVMREKPDAVDIIHEIHRQGGIVIMAHPYLVNETVLWHGKTISRDELIEQFIYEGIDGIEARYTYDKTSYNGAMSKEEIYREIMRRYQGRVQVISGGSDYHADGKKGVKNPRDIGECGLTETEFYQNPVLRSLLPDLEEE